MIIMKELGMEQIEEIKALFVEIFSKEPWNDDWSDPEQIHLYITDLIGNRNSLTLGLFENDVLIGLSMGSVMHWHIGTEYYIYEFCIRADRQGKGIGREFLEKVEAFVRNKQITHIFLQTERTVPAFEFYRKNGFTELEDHVSLVKQFS